MVKKILFVVHRAAPFPGGSEIYVHHMAKECLRRGYDVTVLAHEHKGDYEGVKITSHYPVLEEAWDLIVVHGGDCISQNVVHYNAGNLISPVLYMLIKPSTSDLCLNGLRKHKFLGWSTTDDWTFIMQHNRSDGAVHVPHGIVLEESLGDKDQVANRYAYFKEVSPGMRKYYVSAGGFWPHKGMEELVHLWEKANMPDDTYLFLFGYSDHYAPRGRNVIPLKNWTRQAVLDFIEGAEAYIMNSSEEGFGLVLLEAMLNKTPWISRPHAGARYLDSFGYGTVCYTDDEMIHAIKNVNRDPEVIAKAYDYVMRSHLIGNTVDGIETALRATENDWK